MFQKLVLRGAGGDVLWGDRGRAALALGAWAITKGADGFTLSARVTRVLNPYYVRQTPLLFIHPRRGGFFCWPVLNGRHDPDAARFTAALGPLEY